MISRMCGVNLVAYGSLGREYLIGGDGVSKGIRMAVDFIKDERESLRKAYRGLR